MVAMSSKYVLTVAEDEDEEEEVEIDKDRTDKIALLVLFMGVGKFANGLSATIATIHCRKFSFLTCSGGISPETSPRIFGEIVRVYV
jgi:hypothetical protein